MMNMIDFNKVIELVRSTRELILSHEDAETITVKGRADYVTEVDLKVQSYLRRELGKLAPGYGFLGEEGEHEALDFSRPVWILDPVDGTTNLIHDMQHSCVALALWSGRETVFSVVYNPFHNELFSAFKGAGATLNGQQIHVSKTETLERSLIHYGTSPYQRADAKRTFDLARELFVRAEDVRRLGSAELDLCYVACGRGDAYIERKLRPWDYEAGKLILEEAGGTYTDYEGMYPTVGQDSGCVASNGTLHQELLEVVKPFV